MKAILPGAPWLIAHKSMLGINQPFKVTLNGQDYVLWQNKANQVSALNNICPHLQAPLSNGWVCQERNTITCPFHTLEFDGQGYLYQDGRKTNASIAETLDLTIIGDLIWTYGGFEPRLPIPQLHEKIAEEYDFIGFTAEKSIKSDFLTSLLINYDHNHQNGTHREMFQVKSCRAEFIKKDDIYALVAQTTELADYTPEEIAANPTLGAFSKIMNNFLEYVFPSSQFFRLNTADIKTYQGHILYPETENSTKTFILMYAKFSKPELKEMLQESLLQTAAVVVEQDTSCLESLYPRAKAKIRLKSEDIMYYAQELYQDWENLAAAQTT
jgi:phenylpropionate dioxygenase-like ring-hydroxylating dioxygenase large terminal subunit